MLRKIKIAKSDIWVVISSIVLFLVMANLPIKAKQFGDMDFHQEAKLIASFIHGNTSFSEIYLTKAPGPSLYYSVPYIFVNDGSDEYTFWIAALCWNLIWLTVALLLIKRTVEKLFDNKAGITSLFLIFVLPLPYYYSTGTLAETLAFLGFSFYLYAIVSLIISDKNENRYGFYAGLGLLLMVMARPNMLLTFGLIPIILFLLHKYDYFTLSIKKFTIAFGVSLVVTVFIVTALKQLPGNASRNTQEAYFLTVAHLGRFQFRDEPWDWRFWDNKTRPDSKDYQNSVQSRSELNAIAKEKYHNKLAPPYREWLVNDIKKRPLLVFQQFFVRMLFGNFLQISSVQSNEFKLGPLQGRFGFFTLLISINLVNLAILISAIIGFVKAVRNEKQLWLATAPIFALLIFHGIIYMEQRYLFPVRPFLIVFASPVIHNLFRKIFVNAA